MIKVLNNSVWALQLVNGNFILPQEAGEVTNEEFTAFSDKLLKLEQTNEVIEELPTKVKAKKVKDAV